MTDLISRADAIAYIDRIINSGLGKSKSLNYIHKYISLLPSANDGLRCALAGGRKCFAQGYDFTWCITCPHISEEDRQLVNHAVLAIPSADADGEDLIIKGAKGIQDGLYNIKDGKLFKYKANGGTVRTYPIVPSADAVQGDECDHCVYKWGTKGGDDE